MNQSTGPAVLAGQRAEKAAARAESAATRARRETAAAQGIAPPLPNIPDKPVRLPGKMWSDRQRESVGEFLELLPIIEIVAALSPAPTADERSSMDEGHVEALMNDRLSALMAAKKIVAERVRKET